MIALDYDVRDDLIEACKTYERREVEGEDDCEGHPLTCLDELMSASSPLQFAARPLAKISTTDSAIPKTDKMPSETRLQNPLGATTSGKRKRKNKSKKLEHDVEQGVSLNTDMPSKSIPDALSERDRRKKEAAKQASKQRKKRRRDERRKEGLFDAEVIIRSGWSEKHGTPQVVQANLAANELNAANGAWVGVRKPVKPRVTAIAEGVRDGLRVLKWDGM